MISHDFLKRILRTALGDHSLQVGRRAVSSFDRFLDLLCDAIAHEAAKRFHEKNRQLVDAGRKERRRMQDSAVRDAVRIVLNDPERYLGEHWTKWPPLHPPNKPIPKEWRSPRPSLYGTRQHVPQTD